MYVASRLIRDAHPEIFQKGGGGGGENFEKKNFVGNPVNVFAF